MFPSTITLTISGVARVLNRANQDNFGSTYQFRDADQSISMEIRHSTDSISKREPTPMRRHNVFVEHIKYPTATALLKKATYAFTIREDQFTDPAMSADLAKAVNAWLGTATNLSDISVGNN